MSEKDQVPYAARTFVGYIVVWMTFCIFWILDYNQVPNVTNWQFLMSLAPWMIAFGLLWTLGVIWLICKAIEGFAK